jgi:uncharacterized protein
VRSDFPWLTIREQPELAHYRPFFAEPARPNASATVVRTPSGGELDVADPALAAELGPGGTRTLAVQRFIRSPRVLPVSLTRLRCSCLQLNTQAVPAFRHSAGQYVE